jgi:hypothetical protein
VCKHCNTIETCDDYLKNGKDIPEHTFCPNFRELSRYREVTCEAVWPQAACAVAYGVCSQGRGLEAQGQGNADCRASTASAVSGSCSCAG